MNSCGIFRTVVLIVMVFLGPAHMAQAAPMAIIATARHYLSLSGWNTFLGGSGSDYGRDAAVDANGNIFVTGDSSATWGSPLRAYTGGSDTHVAKLDSSGNLIWNTFLGASGNDYGFSIALDSAGNVYVSGYSTTTWGAPVRAYTGGEDAFAAKLDASGTLLWSTFLGGDGTDNIRSGTVDENGNYYVAGYSNVSWGSPIRPYSGGLDAFIARLAPAGGLAWNTFLGGSGQDYSFGIHAASGGVYLAGQSSASWGSPVQSYASGYDAFATKLDLAGNLSWSTFLGGSGDDSSNSIAVNGDGSIYVAGQSTSVWGSPLRAYTSGPDAFAARLGASGNLVWSTFLGGSGTDYGVDIAASNQSVHVSGWSAATWGSPLRAYTAMWDIFVARLDLSGTLKQNTFLGGSSDDYGYGLTAGEDDSIYASGYSAGTWGTPVHAYQGGDFDVLAAKVDLTPPSVISIMRANPNPTNDISVSFSVTFSESVTNVDVTDFVLGTTGVVGASVTDVSGVAASYIVAVNTGSGNGTLRLDLSDNNTIVDAAANPLGGIIVGDGDFHAGETYTVEKIVTDTRIESHPASWTNSTSAEFTFSATVITAAFECSLEGGAFVSCSSPQSYTGLNEGSHTFAVRARDAMGRVDETPAVFDWEIDPAGPPAGTIIVDSSTDVVVLDGLCTLREAIISANSDVATSSDCVAGQGQDTIVFGKALDSTTIMLNSALPVISDADGLIISGGSGVAISGVDAYRLFYINPEIPLSINDLTLRSGHVIGTVGVTGAVTGWAGETGGAGNHAYGGCLYNNGGIISLTRVTLSDCTAIGGTGGTGGAGAPGYNECVRWFLGSCTGWAWHPGGPGGNGGQGGAGYGGAIFSTNGGTLSLYQSTFSNNSARGGPGGNGGYGESGSGRGGIGGMGLGGGVYITDASATFINDTFFGNSALGGGAGNYPESWIGSSAYGGALYNVGAAVLLNNSTIADNQALGGYGLTDRGPASAGGIFQSVGSISLKNTIVANNSAGNCSGTLDSAGHNLESANTCGLTATGDITGADPLLGPLQDNDGPTHTCALLSGSPAINAGNPSSPWWPSDLNRCATRDQRGVSRPQAERCDIGAYELEQPAAVADLRCALVDGKAQFDWTEVTTGTDANPLTGVTYTVYRSQGQLGFTSGAVYASGLTANTFTDDDLSVFGSAGHTTYYMVQAIHSGLPSEDSNRVGVFTFPLAPGQ